MNGTARKLKRTVSVLAIMIALTLAIVPMTLSGPEIQGASADINTGDFPSKSYFQKYCKTLGGKFESGMYFTACYLPGDHHYLCDETGKNCTFFIKPAVNGGVVIVSNTNGTLTSTGTTTTSGATRTTSGAIIVKKRD